MKSILFSVLFFLMSLTSKANHGVAANITYTYVSGNTYHLVLSFYRDCTGQLAPFNVTIKATSVSCGDSLGVILSQIPGTGQEIPPDCIAQPTTCNGGTLPGIQEWIYEGNITLPSSCPDWIFSYYLCCRNGSISNILNPISSGFYVYARLNNTVINNSPVFLNKPIPFICLGSYYCFDQGAIDIDGDSLVYSLITPFDAKNIPVIYVGTYTYLHPINSSPQMSFNSQTGRLCFTASSLQICILAVLVKEYRNGILIGEVERDIQITILNCPCVLLPVELSDFSGESTANGNVLRWITLTEHNNDYFTLRKSFDMITFYEIAIISSQGNSNNKKHYQFIDVNSAGVQYYKLSQTDYNGDKEEFKTIISLNNTLTKVNDLKIFNILGQRITTITGPFFIKK